MLNKKLSSFLITFLPIYLASKRWEKVGHQELRSTPYKQEIDPWMSHFVVVSTIGFNEEGPFLLLFSSYLQDFILEG